MDIVRSTKRDPPSLQSKPEDTIMNVARKVFSGIPLAPFAMRRFRMVRPIVRHIVTAGCISGALAMALAGTVAMTSGLRVVDMNDQCDPASFNLAIGPGTCVSPH